jgi:hypothetical protein
MLEQCTICKTQMDDPAIPHYTASTLHRESPIYASLS